MLCVCGICYFISASFLHLVFSFAFYLSFFLIAFTCASFSQLCSLNVLLCVYKYFFVALSVILYSVFPFFMVSCILLDFPHAVSLFLYTCCVDHILHIIVCLISCEFYLKTYIKLVFLRWNKTAFPNQMWLPSAVAPTKGTGLSSQVWRQLPPGVTVYYCRTEHSTSIWEGQRSEMLHGDLGWKCKHIGMWTSNMSEFHTHRASVWPKHDLLYIKRANPGIWVIRSSHRHRTASLIYKHLAL